MVIGIKYCGGCNPVFDRRKIVDMISESYPEVIVEYVTEKNIYEIALIINGCTRACSNHENIKAKTKVFLQSEDDYRKLINIIDNLYMEKEAQNIGLERNI